MPPTRRVGGKTVLSSVCPHSNTLLTGTAASRIVSPMTDYAVNIMSVYRRAWLCEHVNGANWYADAHALALELSPDDVWRGAGVIAALSPLKQWNVNARLARNAFDTGIATGNIGMHNSIAQAILDGAHPFDVMRGDKTRSFTEAIATAGNGRIATIDRHAHDIAMAQVFTDSTRKIGKRVYRDMAAAYREVADYTGLSVNAIQAITWITWRREKGIK